MFIIQ